MESFWRHFRDLNSLLFLLLMLLCLFGAYSLSRIHHQSFFALHDGPVLITHLGNCHQESCSEFRSPNCINFEVDPTSPANFLGFHQRKCQKHQKRILPNNAVHSNEKRLNHVGSKYFISMVTKTDKVRSSPIHPVPVPMRCLILDFYNFFLLLERMKPALRWSAVKKLTFTEPDQE